MNPPQFDIVVETRERAIREFDNPRHGEWQVSPIVEIRVPCGGVGSRQFYVQTSGIDLSTIVAALQSAYYSAGIDYSPDSNGEISLITAFNIPTAKAWEYIVRTCHVIIWASDRNSFTEVVSQPQVQFEIAQAEVRSSMLFSFSRYGFSRCAGGPADTVE